MVPTLPERRYLRKPIPLASPEPAAGRTLLALCPTPQAAAYTARTEWTEFVAGQVRRTALDRALTVRLAAHQDRWRLHWHAAAPRLEQAEQGFLEEAGLLLAELYTDLVLDLAPTGALLALANPAAAGAAWARVQAELLRRYPTPSTLLDELVAGVARQLAQPTGLGPSLAYDYLYAALPGDFYQQPFETSHRYVGPKVFPQFFEGLDLHFTESLRLAPAGAPDQAVLRLTGTIDPVATDLAAEARRIGAALRRPADVDPAGLQFAYQATHRVVPGTGLPATVALTVRCTYPDVYRKEYHLRLEAVSPTLTPLLP